jgi:hypothetical protein
MPTDQNSSRRTFLRAAGLSVAALFAAGQTEIIFAREQGDEPGQSGIDFDSETNSYNEIYNHPPLLGRVHYTNRIRIFAGPDPNSESVRNVYGGYIMPIYRAVRGVRYDNRAWSDIWFETNEGYVHSAYAIPCHEIFQQPEEVIGSGFWAEVTVPLSFQHRRPSFVGYRYDWDYYKCYWSQCHRVIDRADDDEGRAWYRIYDDIEPDREAWVQAHHFRRVAPEELAPISPDVIDKHIEINLGEQTLTCFEEGVTVFKTLIASGSNFQDDDGVPVDFSTPYGDYHVQRKRPSRRMRGQQDDPTLRYDVNGVPWCTYFSYTGAAVHGAYWHNNFGMPRSHGCINVTADAAKWVFRWSQPYLGYDEDYRWVEAGELATPIKVV